MKVAVYSTKNYDREFFSKENEVFKFDLNFLDFHLNHETASLAEGCEVVCAFVNDDLSRGTLQKLGKLGVRLVALRCAGFNNVDLCAASEFGIKVVRVPSYSPNAIAEHTLGLILSLNRKIHRAYNRTREGNFSLDGLMGFDLKDKTVGIVGLGKIGIIAARALKTLGCKILVYDPYLKEASDEYEVASFNKLLNESDIISLHCPLTPETHHLIDKEAISKMKESVMLINTSRGAVIDTKAVIEGLKSGRIGYLGIDVYEEEGDLFFEDLSDKVIKDDTLARLQTFPNVLITAHQAFFTQEALRDITVTTLGNIRDFANDIELKNQVTEKLSTSLCKK